MIRPKARFDWPLSDHWKEHIKTFNSILHGLKTDEKWGNYRQNRKNWSDTLIDHFLRPHLCIEYYWQKQAHSEATLVHRVFFARYDLVFKLETLRKRIILNTKCNSQITKSFSDQARISIGKWLIIMKTSPGAFICKTIAHGPKLDPSRDLWNSEEDIISFLETPRSSKIDTRRYVNCTRENWQK